jgi:urease accessory protein
MTSLKITLPLRPLTVCTLVAASGAATAHPLHGADVGVAAGFIHPFLGLDHLLAMVAVGLWAAQLGGRWLWSIPAAFVTAMLAGGALGFLGHTLPLTETLVAGSVLVLGLLVALRVRLESAGLALVACFALFHGLAHAAELLAGAGAAAYAAGFAAATAALHAVGIGLGVWMRSGTFAARLTGTPIALAGCWLLAGAVA